jgi:hypothetical protein
MQVAIENYPDDGLDDPLTLLATAAQADGPHYRPDQVAYDAIWPAAEELWGENWLEGARPGPPLQFPRWDVINGQEVEVCLIARCEALPPIDADAGREQQFFHNVTLNCARTATGFNRDYILASAKKDVEQNPFSHLSSYPTSELAAKTCDSYTFESDGEVQVIAARFVAVESSGEIIWNSADALVENIGIEPDFRRTRLYDDDLQTIGQALMILTGLTEPLAAIEEIKGHPIEDY